MNADMPRTTILALMDSVMNKTLRDQWAQQRRGFSKFVHYCRWELDCDVPNGLEVEKVRFLIDHY